MTDDPDAGDAVAIGLGTVVDCTDLDANVQFFVDEVGARVESISPADDPAEYVLSVADDRIVIRRGPRDVAAHLIMYRRANQPVDQLIAPNGTIVEFRSVAGALVPDGVPALSVVRAGADFGTGRAEMQYRDLVPDRWGGRFIASHIRIPDGGEVADYVHYHRIRFQMIFVIAGWVELVYEDQGPPFRLEAGDCVTQPPEIRHRVLRSSPGLEVVEIGCPAVHDTFVEHEMALPTSRVDPERDFGGQRFVRHTAAAAARMPYVVEGLRCRQPGIAVGTNGMAGAVVIEADGVSAGEGGTSTLTYDGEFLLQVLLHGEADIVIDPGDGDQRHRVGPRDAIAIPTGAHWRWSDWTADFETLEVSLPAGTVRAETSADPMRR